MKIGFFANTYLPISYGTVSSILNFRRGLEELGYEVHIITPRFGRYQDKKTNIYRWPSVLVGYKIKYPVALPFDLQVKKYVQDAGLDIIHCQQPFSVAAQGLKIGRKLGIPVVFTHHCRYEDYIHYIPPIFPRRPTRWFVKKKATDFANKCDHVISPSDSIKEMVEERGVRKPVETIPTGIDWSRFQKGNRERVRKEFGIGADEILLMSNGRFDQEKNIDFLVRTLFPFMKKNKEIKWMHVGDGSLKKETLNLARKEDIFKQVVITGQLLQEDMHHYYAAGDVFVMSSLTETQGMSLLEALGSGLPTVAIRATGVVDQIQHDKNGILIEGEDEEKFLQAVRGLIVDKNKAARLGEAAREFGKSCDYRIRAKRIAQIYQQLARK